MNMQYQLLPKLFYFDNSLKLTMLDVNNQLVKTSYTVDILLIYRQYMIVQEEQRQSIYAKHTKFNRMAQSNQRYLPFYCICAMLHITVLISTDNRRQGITKSSDLSF